jgi:glycosyltransferase involved in cell wall biosynthesis
VRILFDAERLRNPNSGLGQFCRGLGEALVRLRPSHAQLTFLVRDTEMGTFGPGVEYDSVAWWRRFVSRGQYDVWHATHQDSVFAPPRSARVVLTILDLNFLERADYSAARKRRRMAAVQRRVDRADVITTISAYSAESIREHLRVGSRSVRVIYPAETLSSGAVTRPHFAEGAPFLLFVGGVHARKNVHVLLPMLQALPGYRLVLAGPAEGEYAARVRRDVEALGLGDRVVMAGAVSEATRSWLYEHCAGLVFPSLSEGFGLPVVEAMARGAPVFLSRRTSLPEVGGPDAFYFENFEPERMAAVVRDGLAAHAGDPARRDRLRARAARFTWDSAAAEYWELYTALATLPVRPR